ncbi:MAG: protein translocase subunit SecD [bacterium]
MAFDKIKSRTKIRLAFAGVLILALLAGFLDYPAGWDKGAAYLQNTLKLPIPHFWNLPFHLGLDLQGGTHLVYQADVSKIDSADQSAAVEGVRDVIERRVNAYGVSEPLVQTNKYLDEWRVIVELAGVKDVKEAIKMIGETPVLEFKTKGSTEAIALTDEEKKAVVDYNQQAQAKAQDILNQALAIGADFGALANEFSQDPGNEIEGIKQGGDLDWFPADYMVKEFNDVVFNKAEINKVYPQLAATEFGWHIILKEDQRIRDDGVKEAKARHILIQKITEEQVLQSKQENSWANTGLSGKQLAKSQVQFDPQTNEPEVGLEFNDEGKELFAQLTEANVGKQIAIFLDGSIISAPTVNEPIREGKAVITGNFTLPEAKLLTQRLNAGALPVPIGLLQQQTVGASLGQDSVAKSVRAGWWGLLMVAIFMILYYRLPGILAVLALGIYGALVLAIFKLWPVTLTLPGIAGFVMSLGMAVDANVLIFERLKEELNTGRTLGSAIDEGFKRAWLAIRDSNITTLISCLILIWFSTSIIKGFAVTLGIGVLASMFSAITVTRIFLKIISNWPWVRSGWLFGVKAKSKEE